MTEMKLQKEFFDLYQDARWGKFEITLVAPCIWKYNVTWPHTHITKLDFEKESRALEATIKEAWAQEDEDRAEMTLSLLLYRYRELNKERLELKLRPVFHRWRSSGRNMVVEVYIDWDYCEKRREEAGLSLRFCSKPRARTVDPSENDKLTLNITHWHVDRNLLRTEVFEAFYRDPRCTIRTNVKVLKADKLCMSCKASMNAVGPIVRHPNNAYNQDEKSELPPYQRDEK